MSIERSEQPAVNRILTSTWYTRLRNGCADALAFCQASVNGNRGWPVGAGYPRCPWGQQRDVFHPLRRSSGLGWRGEAKYSISERVGCARLPVIFYNLVTSLSQGSVPRAMVCLVPQYRAFQCRKEAYDTRATIPLCLTAWLCASAWRALGWAPLVEAASSHLDGWGWD